MTLTQVVMKNQVKVRTTFPTLQGRFRQRGDLADNLWDNYSRPGMEEFEDDSSDEEHEFEEPDLSIIIRANYSFTNLEIWRNFCLTLKQNRKVHVFIGSSRFLSSFLNLITLASIVKARDNELESFKEIQQIIGDMLKKLDKSGYTLDYEEIMGHVKLWRKNDNMLAIAGHVHLLNIKHRLQVIRDLMDFDNKERDRYDFSKLSEIKIRDYGDTLTFIKCQYPVKDSKTFSDEYQAIVELVKRHEKDIVRDVEDVTISLMESSLESSNISRSSVAFIMYTPYLKEEDLLYLCKSFQEQSKNRSQNENGLLRYKFAFITCVLDRLNIDLSLKINPKDINFIIKVANQVIDEVPIEIFISSDKSMLFIYQYCCDIRYILKQLLKDHKHNENVISNFMKDVYRVSVCGLSIKCPNIWSLKDGFEVEEIEHTFDFSVYSPAFFHQWLTKKNRYNGLAGVIQEAETNQDFRICPVCRNDFILDGSNPGNMLLLSHCRHVICRQCYDRWARVDE